MPEYQDFEEIAHCGGQITFTISCDPQGRKAYSVGFRHARPVPAAWAGLYALAPHGIPVSNFRMGGMGQPWDPPLPPGCVPVFIGSDSRSCWGAQCPQCEGYFRDRQRPVTHPTTCPYCGLKADAFEFLTPAQRAYVTHYVRTLAQALQEPMEPGAEREVIIDMDAVIDQGASQPRPPFYYAAEAQQTRYTCDKCDDFNDIRGRFGYCASCGSRNNLSTFKASIGDLRARLNDGRITPEDAVKSCVSEFDACCRNFVTQVAKRIPMKAARRAELEALLFHNMESPIIASMKSMFDIDLLRGVGADLPFLKMMMHRRHVFEHNAGVADDRYVSESGDPDAREGVLIRETRENGHRLMNGLIRMVENFDADFHQIFPPTQWPIDYHRRRQEMMRQR